VTSVDSSTTDAPADSPFADSGGDAPDVVEDAGPPPAPALCSTYDDAWLNYAGDSPPPPDASVADAVFDRLYTWAGDVGSNGFYTAVSQDCRLANFFSSIPSQDDRISYGNNLSGWLEMLVGCPDLGPLDGGPIGYSIIPDALAGHTFTTADLDLLSSLMVNALDTSLQSYGGPALTSDERAAITALLAYYQKTVSNQDVSDVYSLASCPDAGDSGTGDGGDGGDDSATGDGGTSDAGDGDAGDGG